MAWDDNLTQPAAPVKEPNAPPPAPAEKTSVPETTVEWDAGLSAPTQQATAIAEGATPWHSFFTGAGRTESGILTLGDLGTAGPFVDEDKVVSPEQATKLVTAMTASTEGKDVANMAANILGTETGQDKHGNWYFTYNGNKFYGNPPGLSMQDVSAAGLEALALSPLGRTMKGMGFWKALGLTGLAEGALQGGREVASRSMGADQSLGEAMSRIGLGFGGAVAGQVLQPVAEVGMRYGNKLVRDTIKEEQLAKLFDAAGAKWSSLSDDAQTKVYNYLRNFSPRQVNKALGKADNVRSVYNALVADDLNIPLTKGQVISDPKAAAKQLSQEAKLTSPASRIAIARAEQPTSLISAVGEKFPKSPQMVDQAKGIENAAWDNLRNQAEDVYVPQGENSIFEKLDNILTGQTSDFELSKRTTPKAYEYWDDFVKISQKPDVSMKDLLRLREEISIELGTRLSNKDYQALRHMQDAIADSISDGAGPQYKSLIDNAVSSTRNFHRARKKHDMVFNALIKNKSHSPKSIENNINKLLQRNDITNYFDMRELSELSNIRDMAKLAQKRAAAPKTFWSKYFRMLTPFAAGIGGGTAAAGLGPLTAGGIGVGAGLATAGAEEIGRRVGSSVGNLTATGFDFTNLMSRGYGGLMPGLLAEFAKDFTPDGNGIIDTEKIEENILKTFQSIPISDGPSI